MENEKNEITESGQNNKDNPESSDKTNLEKDSNENNINIININSNNKKESKENSINDPEGDEIINLNDFIIQIKNKNNNQDNQIIEKEKQKSIIQEYIENKNIIKNKDKLICFIEELSNILKTGNNNISNPPWIQMNLTYEEYEKKRIKEENRKKQEEFKKMLDEYRK